MTKHTEVAPQLPAGAAVDFNKLHDAMRAGESAEKARSVAVIKGTVADGDAAPPADPFEGWTKAQLQDRARKLSIRFETDANLDRLKELLLAHPDGVPAEPNPAIIGTDAEAAPAPGAA